MTVGTLIYDGECEFCRRWVDRIRARDRHARLQYVAFQDPEAASFGVPPEALTTAMHLVREDGAVFAGAAAVPQILNVLPGGWAVSWMFAIPGVLWVAHRVYGWVALRRHRLACRSPHCSRGM